MMIKLEMSEALGKQIRKGDVSEHAIPNLDMVSQAIRTGRTDEALEFLEYAFNESKANNDSLVSFVETVLTHLASFGEQEVEKILRQRYYPMRKDWLSVTRSVEESLQRCTESQRKHPASLRVIEEPDRYVVTYDPCGSGGRLRRTRSVGTTKQAYPWSWGEAGVSYYCSHCCISYEIIPIELWGYPIKIHLLGAKPEDPCIHLFYKNPELIPEEYFTRVGMKKDMAILQGGKVE
ncbi:hypothetical protein ACFLTR_03245 [Chloroflexota bacterium]